MTPVRVWLRCYVLSVPDTPAATAGTTQLVRLLLRNRVRMVWNAAWRQGRQRRLLTGGAALMALFGMYVTYGIGSLAAHSGRPSDTAIAGALTLLAGFSTVTSITFALSSLYFARDLEFLHASPARPRVVVISRIYTQLGFGITVGSLLAGPPFVALALASPGGIASLPLAALTVIALVVVPLCLATAFTVVALRLIPARFARDAGGALITVSIFLVTVVNLALRGTEAFSGPPTSLPVNSLGAGAAGSQWSPVGWAARAVQAALSGDVTTWFSWSWGLIAVAIVLPPLVARLIEAPYYSGYLRNATAPRRTRDRTRKQRRRFAHLSSWAVIAAKDLREVRRDPSQMGQLLLPLVLFAVYLGNPAQTGLSAANLPQWFLVALNATFGSLLFAANIALRGVGTEGKRMWLLRISPVRPLDILTAKYAAGFVISAIPACLLFWVGETRSHASLLDVILPTFFVCVMIAGIVALAVGIGALRPRLDWTDPRRAVGIGTTLVYLAMGAVYVVICFIVLGVPYAFSGGSTASVAIADAMMVLMTAGVIAASLAAGGRSLGRIEI